LRRRRRGLQAGQNNSGGKRARQHVRDSVQLFL
jgi:hypothetical protein